MSEPNYESQWWGYIYDQMMAEQQDLVDANRGFYHANLQPATGSVLECACGTGLILLHLLLLDLRLAGVRDLADGLQATQGSWYTWTHPETGRPIRQRVDGQLDFNNQQILDQCFIEYDDISVDFPMTARWIFKEELVLLLRLAGFARWRYFGTPEGDPLDIGPEEQQSYWIIEKG
jgi:hypothetical protein